MSARCQSGYKIKNIHFFIETLTNSSIFGQKNSIIFINSNHNNARLLWIKLLTHTRDYLLHKTG